jgi:hypothetical protein
MALTQVETSGLSGSGASSNSTTGNVFSQTGPFKNRIINGDMRIDQRNAGASVTATTANEFTLDRWQSVSSVSSKFTVQRNAASVTPPSGFTNYLGVTSSSAYTVTSSDQFRVFQSIEGLNISDLAWGTASAVPVTLSFRVRSSLTGTFGGSLASDSYTRSYPFTYTISAANTWTTVSVSVPGDTTGTWLTTNGNGIIVSFGLGVGSTLSGTAGSWSSTAYVSATGATSVVGTNGATFYITGVQLETGSVATPFERRSYGQELALAQRYYQLLEGFTGTSYSTSTIAVGAVFRTEMRASPTVSATAAIQITYPGVNDYTQSSANASIVSGRISARGASVACANFSGLTNAIAHVHNVSVNSAAIAFSAEL